MQFPIFALQFLDTGTLLLFPSQTFLSKFLEFFLLRRFELFYQHVLFVLSEVLAGLTLRFVKTCTLLVIFLVLSIYLLSGPIPQCLLSIALLLPFLGLDDFLCHSAVSFCAVDDIIKVLIVFVSRLLLYCPFLFGVPRAETIHKTSQETSGIIDIFTFQKLFFFKSLEFCHIFVLEKSFLFLEEIDMFFPIIYPPHFLIKQTVDWFFSLLILSSWLAASVANLISLHNCHLSFQHLFPILLELSPLFLCMFPLVLGHDIAIVPVVHVPFLLRQNIQASMSSHFISNTMLNKKSGLVNHSVTKFLLILSNFSSSSPSTGPLSSICPLAEKEKQMTCFLSAGRSQKNMTQSLSPFWMAGLKSKQSCSTSRVVPLLYLPLMVWPWQQVSSMGQSLSFMQQYLVSSAPRQSQSSRRVMLMLHLSCGGGVEITQVERVASELLPTCLQVWAVARKITQARSRYIFILLIIIREEIGEQG